MKHELFPWLILFLPLLSVAVIALFTLHSKVLSSLISIGAVVTGFVLTCLFIAANGFHPEVTETSISWLSIGGLNVDFGLKLDLPRTRLSIDLVEQEIGDPGADPIRWDMDGAE